MGKKTCQKFITLTAIAMFVLMIAFVATTFITIDVTDYDTQMASSDFINGVVGGSIKLNNENYSLSSVTCAVEETGEEIDLSEYSGSDSKIRRELIDRMDFTVISTESRANGDELINIVGETNKTFNLEWKAYNSPAKIIWFIKHPTAKDFLNKIKSQFYSASGVEYDVNDVVLFPTILFVFGIAGAILSVVFRRMGFFLAFPIFWSVIGIISYINGFANSTVPQFFIFSIFKTLLPSVCTIQFVLAVLVFILAVVSIIIRKKLKKAIAAEETSFVQSL